MNAMKKLTLGLLLTPQFAMAEGTSPWLPIPGEFSITANYTFQSGDAAYIGENEIPVSAITGGAADDFERSTKTLLLSYGLSDTFAVDASLGYGDVEVGSADEDDGLTDTNIGLSWRVVDEYLSPGLPTLTLRGAVIIKGDYDGARLASVGNDENGFEFSLLAGKQLTNKLALSGEIGLQTRGGEVPNARHYHINAHYQIAEKWNATLGYSFKDYGGTLDIGGPGFTPARFQEVNAERELVKFGVGYALAANQGVSFTFATVVDGRNTVIDDEIFSLSYTFSL